MAGRGTQEGSVKVEVRRLQLAALIHSASWRQPDHHLQQVCAPTLVSILLCATAQKHCSVLGCALS